MISKPAVALLSEAAIDVIPFQECHVAGARVSPAQNNIVHALAMERLIL